MRKLQWLRSLVMAGSLLSITSCGKNGSIQIVKGLKVETQVINNEVNVRVSSDIDFGNIQFPSLQIPVMKHSEQIGAVSLIPVWGSKTQLVIDINATALADIHMASVSLPNGTLAPLIGTNPAVSVDLGRGAKLYIAAAQNTYALGVAIPIGGLDSLGQSMGGINFFPMFAIDKAVGAAGLFTSREAGKNGFGFFVDLTQYIQGLNWGGQPSLASAKVQMAQDLLAADAASTMREIALDYSELRPSSSQESKLRRKLYDMHVNRVRLKR